MRSFFNRLTRARSVFIRRGIPLTITALPMLLDVVPVTIVRSKMERSLVPVPQEHVMRRARPLVRLTAELVRLNARRTQRHLRLLQKVHFVDVIVEKGFVIFPLLGGRVVVQIPVPRSVVPSVRGTVNLLVRLVMQERIPSLRRGVACSVH
jgi:hypothetical protein